MEKKLNFCEFVEIWFTDYVEKHEHSEPKTLKYTEWEKKMGHWVDEIVSKDKPKRHDINGSIPDNRKGGNVTDSYGEVIDMPINSSVMMYYYDHTKVKPTKSQVKKIKEFIDNTLNEKKQ